MKRQIKPNRVISIVFVLLLVAISVALSCYFGFESVLGEKDDQINNMREELLILQDRYKNKAEEKKTKEKEIRQREEEAKKALTAKKSTLTYTPESIDSNATNGSEATNEPVSETTQEESVIYYFYDPNCGACMIETPIVLEVQSEGVPFIIYNIDEHPEVIGQYSITLVPTFILNGHKESVVFTKQELYDFWNAYK